MAALLAGTSTPASASDATVSLYHNGELKARGTYDDLTDNLCVKAFNGGQNFLADVGIGPVNGDGPSFTWGAFGGDGWQCTGNLSIPEDRRYDIQVRWHSNPGNFWKYSGKVEFYT
jgi:hypothetical protein